MPSSTLNLNKNSGNKMDPTITFLTTGVVQGFSDWYVSPDNTIPDFDLISGPDPVTAPGLSAAPYRQKSILRAGIDGTAGMTWANLDAVFGLSPSPPDPGSLSFRNWHKHRRTIVTIGSDAATEYLLWRNPHWQCFASDIVNDPLTWTYPDTIRRMYSLPGVGKASVQTIVNAVKIPVSIVIGGVYTPNQQVLAAEIILALMLLETDGTMIIRFHRQQRYHGGLFGLIAPLFERCAVIEPLTRTETNERYFVAQNLKHRSPELIQRLQSVADGTHHIQYRNFPDSWITYWQRKEQERSVLPVAGPGTGGYYHLEQLHGWWAIPSSRWRDVVA
jgi:hypothetical protein